MKYKGIDVSCYNPITDYKAVADDGVQFAILKVIRKDGNADKLFEQHWKGFESVNVPIQGVYNYTYAKTSTKAREDAHRVVEILNGRKTMVWLDVEDSSLANLKHNLVDLIRAYAEVIKRAGLQFGVYTYLGFYNSYLRQYSKELPYPFWVARYPSASKTTIKDDPDIMRKPEIDKEIYGWQYSSTGSVKGITGRVDLNEWYVDIEAKSVVNKKAVNTFKDDLAKALKKPQSISAQELLEHTITVSTTKNKNSDTVTALERFLKSKGYYHGIIEADINKRPVFGNGMAKATALFQSEIVGLKHPDKEWTSKGKSYKKALNL